jgi:hypothetical protein
MMTDTYRTTKPSRADKLARQILDHRAKEAERRATRPTQPQESGPWWKKSIGFDPYQVTKWRVIAGPDPGYLPTTPMQQGAEGFYIHCKACNAHFESKGLAYCADCMKLPAEERHAIARLCWPHVSGSGVREPNPSDDAGWLEVLLRGLSATWFEGLRCHAKSPRAI